MGELRAERLTLAYDKTPVVRDLDVRIASGGITALIGANGCGKSTLLRALARLLAPRAGAVYLDGKAISQYATREVARRLAILPQAPVAPEGLTVGELVGQGRYPYQGFLRQWSAEDEHHVQDALRRTEMTGFIDRPLDTLSGGQRQRAWIAMSLAQDTGYLLLDEPTTYLDLAHQIDVLDLLTSLNRDAGRTIVLVLHDLNQACRYADHLIAMHDGGIVAEGDPSTIVTPDLIRAVFGLDVRIIPDPVTGTPLCVPEARRHAPVRIA